jgi:hypothetical protein
VIEDENARQILRQLAREYHRELVTDRGMDMEARVLEVIQTLQDSAISAGLPVKEIAALFADRHQDDFERKITPHWIGNILRRKLGLKTERHRDGYAIPPSEEKKLGLLFEKYGISVEPAGSVNFVNSVNSVEGTRTEDIQQNRTTE